MSEGLSIREVVSRTGLEAATLRMWEQRHGFPIPDRLPSGHRRYSEDDVELILGVVRDRQAGLELRAAIEKAKVGVRDRSLAIDDASIYAGLRRTRPNLIPYLLAKSVMVQLCHAIEDECCAGAHPALLMASFQQERFYRQAQARWLDLTGPAETAVVMADFQALHRPDHGAIEIPIERTDPIGREWSLICDAPDFTALLAGWERPGQDEVVDAERTFETVWSVEPGVVRDAARVAGVIAERSAPGAVPGLAERLEEPVDTGSPPIELLERLTNRMVAYVGGARALPAPRSSAAD